MKFSGDDLGHILVVSGGLFASGLEGYRVRLACEKCGDRPVKPLL